MVMSSEIFFCIAMLQAEPGHLQEIYKPDLVLYYITLIMRTKYENDLTHVLLCIAMPQAGPTHPQRFYNYNAARQNHNTLYNIIVFWTFFCKLKWN